MTRPIETYERTFALDDIEIQRGGDGRTVTAYAAVFDTPAEILDQHGHYREEINRAAFNRTLAHGIDRVGVFYNHGVNVLTGKADAVLSIPMATPLEIKPDGRGLLTVTRYNRSAVADATLEAIKGGEIKGQSFRGRIFRSEEKPGSPLKTIVRHELGLKEYGPTPFPAYEGAGIMAVRSAEAIAAELAAMTEDERAELIRYLSRTPATDPLDIATPAPGPGAEDSHDVHSGRLTIRRNRVRMEQALKGIRREAS